MTSSPFVHLRVHTAYSLSMGAIRIADLSRLCAAYRMPAVAITDNLNLFGGMEFSTTLARSGIQPIIGCQLRLARESTIAAGLAGQARVQDALDDMVVLVQDQAGYRNLLALLGIAHLDSGGAGEPHIAYGDLERHSAGLIALTGGPAGPVGRLLGAGQGDAAVSVVKRLKSIFPGRLYVELMRHGVEIEAEIEPLLLDLAEQHKLPVVATNEAFFPTADMFEAHDALICIAEGALVASSERRRLTPEHYFKSGAEMAKLFADLPDAIENTVLIARRCAFMIEPVKPILPPYDAGTDQSEEEVLRDQARALLEMRLRGHALNRHESDAAGEDAARRYRERLEYELDVICQMGFAGYFLIVAEFILWARSHGIPVGPGRGSGAGSVVAWALTITDLDPLRFGLLFERFLNPERISMPDFDIDFCQDRRDEVIRHVQEKYGRDRVAQIITFGKLQARAVLRDVGRVLGMPYGYVDRICKLVPNNPANPVTLKQAIDGEPQLQAMISEDESVARLVGIASRLEGLYRHASTHAAGVVIGDRPLRETIPLYRDPRSELPVTGYNMKWVESAGLVKFDFLGLKTLTVLARAVQILADSDMARLDLSNLPLDDSRTYEMLGRGDTVGVFQLESAGMRDVLRRLKPDKFEDIIAVVALYRPGPMDNIPSYIRRKHGEEEPDYLYPTLEPILSETYGIIIYQEQVMQIAQELSGYSLGAADILRRAMGKKNKDEMERQREIFVEGAKARGVSEGKACFIFDLVNKFAGYGFNKSHAAAYALVAYQTAYLKANFPVAFFAASLSLEIDHPEKINIFRRELDRIGIALLPPDINASDANFIVELEGGGETKAGAIRYGLAAVKNVGQAAMEALVDERRRNGPFVSLDDFCRRLDPHQVNKRQLENLARAGAFDRLNVNRRQVLEGAETILRHAGAAVRERNSGQMGLFGTHAKSVVSALHLPATDDWPLMDRLKEEFQAIGFYLSAHPMNAYDAILRRLKVVPFAECVPRGAPGTVSVAGTVTAKRERTSGKGSRYAFVELSDASGVFEVTVFSELLATCRDILEVGNSLLIKAAARPDGDYLRLTAQSVELLDHVAARTASTLVITLGSTEPLTWIKDNLSGSSNASCRVKMVCWIESGQEVEVDIPGRYAIGADIVAKLRQAPGVYDIQQL